MSFTDVPENCISIVGQASVDALSAACGTPLSRGPLPRQRLLDGRRRVRRVRLAGLRDRARRVRNRASVRPHPALCRDQRQSRDRAARPHRAEGAQAALRPRRHGRLRGGRARRTQSRSGTRSRRRPTRRPAATAGSRPRCARRSCTCARARARAPSLTRGHEPRRITPARRTRPRSAQPEARPNIARTFSRTNGSAATICLVRVSSANEPEPNFERLALLRPVGVDQRQFRPELSALAATFLPPTVALTVTVSPAAPGARIVCTARCSGVASITSAAALRARHAVGRPSSRRRRQRGALPSNATFSKPPFASSSSGRQPASGALANDVATTSWSIESPVPGPAHRGRRSSPTSCRSRRAHWSSCSPPRRRRCR